MTTVQSQKPPATSDTSTSRKSSPIKRILIGVAAGIGVLALIAVAVWWFRPPEMHGIVMQSPQRVADFSMEASNGEVVSLSDFRGKPVLVYFGYTFCPDVCPTTLSDLKTMMNTLGKKADNVQVIMISVDPARDTPEQLATYLDYFDPRFLGMTGTKDDIDAAATQFGIYYEAHEGTPESGYLVDHTATTALVDKDGYLREIFSYGTPGEDIASDVAYWLR